MQTWMMMAVLATPGGVAGTLADEAEPARFVSYEQTAEELGQQLQTGTLLFNRGDCLAIRMYTASPYTHVAVVVLRDGQPTVYDSMNGSGVRRQPLCDYLHSQCPDRLHVFHPQQVLTAEQGRALEEYLDSQLDRPYAVRHYLTGRRSEGLHCSEYVTDALMSIELLRADRPSKVSPASLATGITTAEIYTTAETLDLSPPPAPVPEGANRCHQMWIDTKQCFGACCDKLSGWILCR